MTTIIDPATPSLSDEQLLLSVKALACSERRATAQLVAALAELDRRKLFLGQGCRSLFTYCTEVLLLSEHAAYGRIEAARASRRFPAILDRLADGSVTLTTVCLLAPVLTSENHDALLAAARHKSRRDVERLVAETRPQPDVPSLVRKLPAPRAHETAAPSILAEYPAVPSVVQAEERAQSQPAAPLLGSASRAAVTVPLVPERYKIQFTACREAYEKFRRAQALLRHVIPNGDPAGVFERALDVLLVELERKNLAVTAHPRQAREVGAGSRHIPAAVRREVWRRDGARCAFVGAEGRCSERDFPELHHVVPFAVGVDELGGHLARSLGELEREFTELIDVVAAWQRAVPSQ